MWNDTHFYLVFFLKFQNGGVLMSRLEELEKVFKDIDSNIKTLVDPLIKEVVFLED